MRFFDIINSSSYSLGQIHLIIRKAQCPYIIKTVLDLTIKHLVIHQYFIDNNWIIIFISPKRTGIKRIKYYFIRLTLSQM